MRALLLRDRGPPIAEPAEKQLESINEDGADARPDEQDDEVVDVFHVGSSLVPPH